MKKKITSHLTIITLCLLPFTGWAQNDTLSLIIIGGQPLNDSLPDLIISNLEARILINPDTDLLSITYIYGITNIGNANIPINANGIGLRLSVSEDQIQSDDDILISIAPITERIPPGETIVAAVATTAVFNPQTTPYLTMKVDRSNFIQEIDESNNFASVRFFEPQPIPLIPDTINSQLIIEYSKLTEAELTQIHEILLDFDGVQIDRCNCKRSIVVWKFRSPKTVEDAIKELKRKLPEIFGKTENAETKAVADGNELIDLKVERQLNGFELEPNSTPTTAAREVVVYMIDSGLDTTRLSEDELRHLPRASFQLCTDIVSRGFNYQFPPKVTADFNDENCHGTFGYHAITKGVSDSIKVVPLKVFNKKGEGTLFGIICAIYHAIDNGADIINISAGYQGKKNAILEAAIKEADNLGIFIVAAAGNNGENLDNVETRYYPAAFGGEDKFEHFISVASINAEKKELSDDSNYGKSYITMAAPGEGICGKNHKGNPVITSGTSMAAFYVTRELAIYMSKQNRGDANRLTKDRFLESQQKLDSPKDETTSGVYLDVKYERCSIIFKWIGQLFSN